MKILVSEATNIILVMLCIAECIRCNKSIWRVPLALFLGAIALLAGGMLESILGINVSGYSAVNILLIGPIEEFCKGIMVFLLIRRYNRRDQCFYIRDSLLLSILVAVGFALPENAYFAYYSNSLMIGVMRSVCSAPGHVIYCMVIGAATFLMAVHAKCGYKGKAFLYLLAGFVIASAAHGIFDLASRIVALFSVYCVLVLICIVYIVRLFRSVKEIDLRSM